jgi:glycosyltransferase involved in cell wall biosynthesis
MVLLEAMATGLPVVATEVGSVSRVVENGGTGLLVPPGDQEALGGALARLVADAEARRRMGVAARRRVVEHFSVERMVAAYESLFTAPWEDR